MSHSAVDDLPLRGPISVVRLVSDNAAQRRTVRVGGLMNRTLGRAVGVGGLRKLVLVNRSLMYWRPVRVCRSLVIAEGCGRLG